MTKRFKYLLRENGHTQASWAKALGLDRTRLTQALGNVPGRGRDTRWKIAAYIQSHFQHHPEVMLQELGWNARGEVVGLDCSTGNVPAGGGSKLK